MKHNSITSKGKKKIILSRRIRILVFIFFILLAMIVDLESGIISSASLHIKRELNMTDSDYSIFAVFPFIGRLFGIIFFTSFIQMDAKKITTLFSIIVNGSIFFIYNFISNRWFLLIPRFLSAFSKVFISIYIPLWIDQFGIKQYKTIMFTIVYMINPYGQIIGFAIGTMLFHNNWVHSFNMIGITMLCMTLFIIITPHQYFSTKLRFYTHDKSEHKNENKDKKISIFIEGEDHNNKEFMNKERSVKYKVSLVFRNGLFLFSCLTRTSLYAVFQVIHQFLKDYTIRVIVNYNEKKLVYYYTIATILGPSCGSLLGGYLSNKVGGYENKRSVFIMLFFGLLASFSIIPLIKAIDLITFNLALLLFFFTTSATLPTLSGYTVNSVTFELKGIATGIDILFTTFLGKMPGPIIYGVINDKYKLIYPKLAWGCVMGIYYISFMFIILTCICHWRRIKKEEEHKEMLLKKVNEKKNTHKFVQRIGKVIAKLGRDDNAEIYDIAKGGRVSKKRIEGNVDIEMKGEITEFSE